MFSVTQLEDDRLGLLTHSCAAHKQEMDIHAHLLDTLIPYAASGDRSEDVLTLGRRNCLMCIMS